MGAAREQLLIQTEREIGVGRAEVCFARGFRGTMETLSWIMNYSLKAHQSLKELLINSILEAQEGDLVQIHMATW